MFSDLINFLASADLSEASSILSTTTNAFSLAISVKADFKAIVLSFLFILNEQSLGVGPNTIPPPLHKGDLLDPARALPVPFCFHGFLPPPDTSDLVLALAVP